ncbi:MAG TPA: endolytic transglycosylase MltG [Gemmatimonadaceae bacterium]|nr:endolytic transglycosylase MltG [Gemmatimonadaceae bacterium]
MTRNILLLVAFATLGCAQTPRGAPIRVIVPRGATFSAATDSLSRAGLVGSPTLFKLYARFKRSDRNIKPGTYLLKRGTPWPDIVSALNGGRGLVNTITIPEGFSLLQIVPQLSQALSVPPDSVQAAVRDTAILRRLEIPTPTLEGYLFPDTYAFPDGTKAREAVGEMVKRFEREWKPDWTTQLAKTGLKRHEVVTLASIVEREAKVPAERPVIAGVYMNRLRAKMLLQADPTVQYAHGKHSPRVLLKDLQIDSPYNTYRYTGLPPGPIASPGGPSLSAALRPDSVPFLYFVAHPDGHHEFRRTLAEHETAVRAVRAIR